MKNDFMSDSDYLLAINKLNHQKYNAFMKMKNLELNGKTIDREPFDDYQLIYDVHKKKIGSLESGKAEQLIDTIYSINPRMNTIELFESILNSSEQYLVLKKTLIDLGEIILSLFNPEINDSKANYLEMLNQLFGGAIVFGVVSTKHDNNLDKDAINDYMIYDFFSTFLSVLQTKIEECFDNHEKETLLDIKYNLIFLIPGLEKKALLEHFIIESDFDLISTNKIQSSGLSLEEYYDNLDMTILDWYNSLITSILCEEKIGLVENLLLSTLTILLNSEDDYLSVLDSLDNYDQFEITDEINDILVASRKYKSDNNQKRKKLF